MSDLRRRMSDAMEGLPHSIHDTNGTEREREFVNEMFDAVDKSIAPIINRHISSGLTNEEFVSAGITFAAHMIASFTHTAVRGDKEEERRLATAMATYTPFVLSQVIDGATFDDNLFKLVRELNAAKVSESGTA